MRDSRQIVAKREVRMERTQLMWLTLGTVLAMALMFTLGMMAGRRSAHLDPPAVNDPVAHADDSDRVPQDLTFYETLTAPKQPQTAPPAAPAMPTPAGDDAQSALNAGQPSTGEYTIQVGAYQTRAEAQAYVSSLDRKGFHAFIVEAALTGKGTWYRVRLGRFATEAAAAQGKQLLARVDIPAWVIRAE